MGSSASAEMNSLKENFIMAQNPTFVKGQSGNKANGSTPDCFKLQTEEILPFISKLTKKGHRKPFDLYLTYPRAVTDYDMFEKLMVPIMSNGALKKLIHKQGREEQLKDGDHVLVNYYIYVEGCSNCLESNKQRGKRHSFVLGEKRGGIPVIELGTLTMRVKEVAAFLANSEYGKIGTRPNWIPSDRRVLCIIEVLSRLSSPLESSSIINLVQAERKLLGFDEIYKFAVERQMDATKDTKNNKQTKAMRKYLQAVACLQDATPKDDEQQQKKIDLFRILYSSIVICGSRTSQTDVLIEFAQRLISLPIPETKMAYEYFRCGKALYLQRKFIEAKPFADKALELLQESDVNEEVLKLCKAIDKELGKLRNRTGSLTCCSNSSCGLPSSSLSAAKEKIKSRRSSFCAGFLLRRLSEPSSK